MSLYMIRNYRMSVYMICLSSRFLARSLVKMSGHNPLMRLEQRAAEADQIIEYLKQQVQLLKEKASKILHQGLEMLKYIFVHIYK